MVSLILWAACVAPTPADTDAPVVPADTAADTPEPDEPTPEPPKPDAGVYVELPNGAVYDSTGEYQRALDGRLICYLLQDAAALDLIAVGVDTGVLHPFVTHIHTEAPVDLSRARDFNLDAWGETFLFGDASAIWRLDAAAGEGARAQVEPNLYQSSWRDAEIVHGGNRVYPSWDALVAGEARRYPIPTPAQVFAGDGGFSYGSDHTGMRLQRFRYVQGDTVASYAIPQDLKADLYYLRAFDVVGEDVVLFGEFSTPGGPRDLELRAFHGPTSRSLGSQVIRFVGEAQGVACAAGRAHPTVDGT